MKKRKKMSHAHRSHSRNTIGLQKTRVRKVQPGDFEQESASFTPGELGEPDATPQPDADNPEGVQGGRGPTNQEGEGERQSAELEELDKVEPEIDLDKPR
jgi:hypothetical protein